MVTSEWLYMKAELKGYQSTRGIFHQSNTDKDIKFFVRHWKEGGVFDKLGQWGIGQQGLNLRFVGMLE